MEQDSVAHMQVMLIGHTMSFIAYPAIPVRPGPHGSSTAQKILLCHLLMHPHSSGIETHHFIAMLWELSCW